MSARIIALFFSSSICFMAGHAVENAPVAREASGGIIPPQDGDRVHPRSTVSLDLVLQLARDRSPAISAARARVLEAEGQKLANSIFPDPRLIAGWGRGSPRDGGTSRGENSFEVAQSVPAPWGLRARARSGVARIEVAEDEVEAVTAEVLLEAKRIYYEAVVGESQARALVEAADDARSLRDLVARRVDAGEAAEGDRLRTFVESRRAELDARAAQAEAEGARATLNRFLLGALGSDFSVSSDLDPRQLPPSPDDLVEIASSRSPAYKAALSRVEAAKWTASAERAARLPGLDFSVYRLEELDRQATGLTFGVSIPLWNRNQGAVRISRGALAEAESDALGLRSRIEAEVERLARRDRVARELAIGYSQELIPAATETLSIARFSLEQGEASLLTWLEARRSYLELLRASYGAQLEAFLTRAELERLTGELDASVHP